jgi:diaminohydroxyphosphoribosylaminopyrimidine deaminase/5-amino-6-(5-phosphoribosylamino)uracil reductase
LLDARGRVPARGPLFDTRLAPTLVFTTRQVDRPTYRAWLSAGAEVIDVAPGQDQGVDLHEVLSVLGQRGVLQALVEGGPTVAGAFVRAGLVDRAVVYVGARTLGEAGRSLFAGPGPMTIEQAGRWRLLGARQMADDARLDYEPLPSEVPA